MNWRGGRSGISIVFFEAQSPTEMCLHNFGSISLDEVPKRVKRARSLQKPIALPSKFGTGALYNFKKTIEIPTKAFALGLFFFTASANSPAKPFKNQQPLQPQPFHKKSPAAAPPHHNHYNLLFY